jgi:hypothetical protein
VTCPLKARIVEPDETAVARKQSADRFCGNECTCNNKGTVIKHKRKLRKLWQETGNPACRTAVN